MNEEQISSETHIPEEQLLLFYYGETEATDPVESHLSQCERCRAEFRALQTVLNTVNSASVPERGPDYGTAVWRKIEKRVGARAKFRWFPWWTWAPVATALLVLAFWAGRLSRHPEPPPTVAANGPVRERVLILAVGDHLERSQMVLAEISNAPQGKGKLDISSERRMAEDLLDSNRLFRQTANTTGDAAVADVLDDLERVLLEIANGPSEVSSAQLAELREQIKDRGLLFKVRVMGNKIHQEEGANAPKQDKKREGTQL